MAIPEEQVLVVPTETFRTCGYFQGFNSNTEQYLGEILNPNQTQYRPRAAMESDPSFKQLIPYCVFRHVDAHEVVSLFQYTRGSGQGESRLHRKRSIGVGGHISSIDVDVSSQASPYEIGMQRELDEEISIGGTYTEECVGLINDDENEVGQVHLGVVHIFDVAEQSVVAKEADIADAGFETLDQIFAALDQFETWSQICLKSLFQT